MDLDGLIDLGGVRVGRGRQPQGPLSAEITRSLTAEDVLSLNGDRGMRPPAVQTLRQSHHQLAKLLAKGLPDTEVSLISGYQPASISILKADPAFQELLVYYKSLDHEAWKSANADLHNRLASAGFDSLEVLHERLLENPDRFSNKELVAIVEMTADRTGHGKTSTVNSNVTHALDAETLARIRGANAAPSAPLPDTSRADLIRLAHQQTSLHPEAVEADWEPCEGGGLREEGGAAPEEVGDRGDPIPPLGSLHSSER